MFKKIKKIIESLKIENITIDITSGNTIIYQQNPNGGSIKVNEPAVLIIDEGACVAFGQEAVAIAGKCPEGVVVAHPIQGGVIADPNLCEQLLRHYFKKLNKSKTFYCIYPNVLAVIPHSATASSRKIITETIDAVGARSIEFTSSLQAAACGIGANKESSGASIIMNIAKDYTEIGIISLNKIHHATTYQVGYDDFQRSIIEYIRGRSEFTIGVNSAKKALDALGAAHYLPEEDEGETITISGLLKRTSVPADLSLSKMQVYSAIRPLVDKLISGLLEVLEKAKEDMADDLKDNGVNIIGIGGSISRMDIAITEALSIRAKIATNYETCIVEGAGLIQASRQKK